MKKGFLLSSSSSSSSKVVNERNKNKTSSVILPDDQSQSQQRLDIYERIHGIIPPIVVRPGHLEEDTFRIYSELFVTITSRMVVCSSSIIMMVQDPPTKVQQLSQSKDNGGWIGCRLEDKQQIIIVLLNNINNN